jgi:signal transduction histidine kinase/ligand-binding sensor domain-containing protein
MSYGNKGSMQTERLKSSAIFQIITKSGNLKVILINYLIAFCLLQMSSSLYAQKTNIKFVPLNEGLSQRTITCILQDKKGYMWFGTYNGLNKYDGSQMIVYENIDNDSTSLSHNLIADIFEDSKGNLWVGTEGGGLNLYDRNNNNFIRFRHNPHNKYSLNNDHITEIFEDKSYHLWIGTEGGGLNLFDPVRKTFTRIKDGLNENAFRQVDVVYEDSKSNLWVGFRGGELDKYDRTKNVLQPVHFKQGDLNTLAVKVFTGIKEDEDGRLWIATYGNGLVVMCYDSLGNSSYIRYVHDDNNSNSLSNNIVRSILIDKSHRIWIGTENGGLNLYDGANKNFRHFTNNKNDKNSISSNSIWSIFEDNLGRLWFGSFDQGLDVVDKYYDKFITYSHSGIDNSSLINDNVSCLIEDDAGNLWIGTDGGGVDYFDRKKNIFIHSVNDRKNKKSLSSNAVLTLCKSSRNNLWIGTWAGGINVLNEDGRSFSHYNKNNSGLSNDNVFQIIEGPEDEIYIATFGGGLNIFNEKTKQFIHFTHDELDTNSIASNEVLSVYLDSKKILWCGFHDDGMDKMIRESNGKINFRHYVHKPESKTSLSDNRVNTFFEDSKNNFWIGTANGGLNLMHREKESFKTFNKSNGLPSTDITGILEDNAGNLWISTSKGISRFNLKNKNCRNYDVSDGLQGEEFLRNAAYKSKHEEMFFGGRQGFNSFIPDSIRDNPNVPPVYLKDFKIFNKSVIIGDNSPLKKSIGETKEITLSYRQSVFTIEFVALNYTHSEKTRYAFKLEDLESDWNYVGSKNSATYTNLDAGKYIFKVKASNNDGVWNEDGISLIVNIAPPFWDKMWFRISVVILLLISIYGYFNVRLRIVKNNTILLENLVENRTKELNSKNLLLKAQTNELNETNKLLIDRQQQIEEQAEELMTHRDQLVEVNAVKDKLFMIVAHDLKNPFNALMGFAELLSTRYENFTDERRKAIVEIILNSSKNIFELLTNLLNWSRAQRGSIVFNPVKSNVIGLIREDMELIKDVANQKQISLNLELPVDELILNMDPDLVSAVIRNLLTNAVKFTNFGGSVTLIGIIKDSEFVTSITDTGVGIPPEGIDQLFRKDSHYSTFGTNNEKGTGLGLIVCKDFIEMHKGKIWIEKTSELGSTFCFSLPLSV